MGSAASTVVHHAQSSRKTKTLLLQYGDAKGEVQEAFRSMRVSRAMRLSWLQLWQSMDEDGSNLLDYQEFVEACGLADDLWSSRVFNLLDKNFTGCVNFLTFFKSIPRLLVFDRSNAMEVAFRMCSRRGATCKPENAVLDEKDIRIIVEQRYPKLDRRHTGHRAVGILAHLDDDCSGGVSFEEFEQFCNVNPVLLTAVQHTLQSVRQALFGEQFWKDFTVRARTFDKATQNEIFCSNVASNGDPATGGPAAASTTHLAAASTKRQFQTISSVAATKSKHAVGGVGSLAHTTGGIPKKITTDANLGRYVTPESKGYVTAGEDAKPVVTEKKGTPTTLAGATDNAHIVAEVEEKGDKLQTDEDTAGEALKDNPPGKPTALWDAARDKAHMGRLKAAGTGVKALHRMQVLATRKEWKGPEHALNTASLGRLLSSTLPHQLLHGAEVSRTSGRSVAATVATVGSSQALQTLKRATRIMAVARNASDVLVKRPRSERDIGFVRSSSALSPGGGERGSGSSTDEALREGGEGSACIETPRETPTIAEPKTRVLRENERQPWVVTEQFYAHLATAAARLDAKRTSEKGYDFSADFPKLWCERRMHGGHGDPDNLSRQQRSLSASRVTAATYLRFIALWQESRPGRSKLDMAFRRWRLYTCDVAMKQPVLSTSSKTARDCSSGGIVPDDASVAAAPRHKQSVTEIWEAAGGVSRRQNLHEIIMMKERADRPLPWELCEDYEAEMVERVNHRQVENNVPILPIMPFC